MYVAVLSQYLVVNEDNRVSRFVIRVQPVYQYWIRVLLVASVKAECQLHGLADI